MDKARVLSLFIGVVRAGSFSQAAVAEGLAPQSVSKAIGQLEQYLGVRLFHRTTRSLSLTDEGQRLYELSHPGLRLLDDALEQVRSSGDEVSGLIRIAAPTSFGSHLLGPLLCAFRERYPKVSFDLVLADQFTDLVERKIDVGFRAGSAPERNLVARRLGDVTLKICAAPGYIAQYGAPKTFDELAHHRCTGYRQANTGRLMPWEVMAENETVFVEMPCVASFNTVESEVSAVVCGLGIGQLASYMIDADLASGRLVHLLPELDTHSAGIYLYYPQRTRIPLRVRHFIDYAYPTAKRLLGGG